MHTPFASQGLTIEAVGYSVYARQDQGLTLSLTDAADEVLTSNEEPWVQQRAASAVEHSGPSGKRQLRLARGSWVNCPPKTRGQQHPF